MTINERIKDIRQRLKLTQEKFAEKIGLTRSNYAQLEIGKSSPTLETVTRIVNEFNIPYQYIVEGKDANLIANLNANPNDDEGLNDAQFRLADERGVYRKVEKEKIMVVTQDSAGNDTIPIINIRAAANYITGYNSQEYIKELDFLTMPRWMLKRGGLYRFFTVLGDSMEPTFHDGQYILCRRLEISEYDDIADLSVHVLVLDGIHHSGIYIKRVKNRLGDHRFIRCRSDNRAHAPFNAYAEDILEIWRVEWYFTSYFPNLAEDFFNKYEELQHRIEDLEIDIQKVKSKNN